MNLFKKNKNVDKIKSLKNVKTRDRNKNVNNVLYIYGENVISKGSNMYTGLLYWAIFVRVLLLTVH